MTFALDTWVMTCRDVRRLLRQPWWIAITLFQPLIWLLLYGALFQNIVQIPGFEGDDYIQFLVPGIVVMTALFSSGWSGMTTLEEIERGVTARFLVSPVSRASLIAGRVMQGALAVVVQSVIIVLLAVATGASFPGGVGGVVVLLVVSCILGFAFGSLSNALAIVARREETVIAINNFVLLPLTFLSTAFMQADLVPGWIADVAKFNPANWAIVAGREAVDGSTDWGVVASRTGLLIAFAALSMWIATRAFRAYQRSV
jgi:ABC-2 type transport system permease protein